MKRILINLKDYQHKALRTLSFQDSKSISEHVRRAVDEYIKRNKQGEKR